MRREKLITSIIIVYLITGLFFASSFAIYYHWPLLSFLSPGFFAVTFTWPFQIPGLILDFIAFGWAGKPI